MPTKTLQKKENIVVSALILRTNLGKILDRIDDEGRSVVIKKRGATRAVLLSIQDYVKLAAPEPEVLRIIGEISVRNGTDKLTSRQIDQIIKETRADRKKKR
jgi:prevent-host-death family protein